MAASSKSPFRVREEAAGELSYGVEHVFRLRHQRHARGPENAQPNRNDKGHSVGVGRGVSEKNEPNFKSFVFPVTCGDPLDFMRKAGADLIYSRSPCGTMTRPPICTVEYSTLVRRVTVFDFSERDAIWEINVEYSTICFSVIPCLFRCGRIYLL